MKFLKRILSAVLSAVMTVTAIAVPVSAEEIKLPDNEAIAFVDSLGAIWNLGNAFDAVDCTWLSDKLDYETGWCGAKTTEKLIKAIAEEGFKGIRIPVSWNDHVDGSFNIDEAWMNRVKEVVDWSLDAGLSVIINVHHDVEKGYYYPSSDQYKTSKKYMTAVWKQISATFKDYDERLIFETINEPRLKGTDQEWWFNVNNPGDTVSDSIDCINKLNQAALDTIREAGGKNKTRYILLGGYCNSIDGITVEGFKIPKDNVKNRIIIDFHLYTKGKSTYKKTIDKVYETYVSKGIPAILSEYNRDAGPNEYNEYSADYLGGWVAYARERGISCAIWDNNDVAYKLIDRKTVKWTQKEIADSIVKNSKPLGLKSSSSSSESKGDDEITVSAKQKGFYASVSWNEVDGASKYRLYRATSKTGKKTLVKTTTSLKTTDKTVTVGTKYYYFVKSYDSASKKWSGYSDAKYLYVKKSNAKTTISEAEVSGKNVKLSWKSVTGGDKYAIYRADSKDGDKTKLGTTKKLTYTDKTAKKGETYYYFVRVYDTATKKWSNYSTAFKVTVK